MVTNATVPVLVVRRGGVAALGGVEISAGPGAAPDAGDAGDTAEGDIHPDHPHDEHADVRGVTRQMQAADLAAAVAASGAGSSTHLFPSST